VSLLGNNNTISNLLEELALDDENFKMLKKADRQMRFDMRQAK
jgi:hypothetical protein